MINLKNKKFGRLLVLKIDRSKSTKYKVFGFASVYVEIKLLDGLTLYLRTVVVDV